MIVCDCAHSGDNYTGRPLVNEAFNKHCVGISPPAMAVCDSVNCDELQARQSNFHVSYLLM